MINAPRGTSDVLPQDAYKWHFIENIIRELADNFGFREIRIPTFEHTELFLRGVGETTDVVQKEMYTFDDRGGRSITLRPEGTAGVVRAYLENSLYADIQPTKVYYMLSIFRYEKPQKGRLREHHQFGVEVFGAQNPSVDAEIISLGMTLFNKLGVKGLELNINSIGCPVCRKDYNDKLKEFLRGNLQDLCETCQSRYDRNPLRILDCKEDKCKLIVKNAPVLVNHLCDECSNHFNQLQNNLSQMGIKFKINPFIVRGLDYYTKTVFEIISNDIGSQGTVCGGGRYDGLVEQIGDKPTPGIGFGLGLERLLNVLESQGIEIPKPKSPDLFIASIGENADKEALRLVYDLRKNNISCEKDHMSRSLKAQMKYADKLGYKYSIVLGDDELVSRKAILKNMQNGEAKEVSIDNLANEIK